MSETDSVPEESPLVPSDVVPASPKPIFGLRDHKSCDACKARKVKCPNTNYPDPCGNCVRRKTTCHFVTKHLRVIGLQSRGSTPVPTPVPVPAPVSVLLRGDDIRPRTSGGQEGDAAIVNESVAPSDVDVFPKLYVDHLLARAQDPTRSREDVPFVKGNGIFGASYHLTFFSESRLLSLSTRLQNNKVNKLVGRINDVINRRLRRNEAGTQAAAQEIQEPGTLLSVGAPSSSNGRSGGRESISSSQGPSITPELAAICIRRYFERAQVQYPFIDRPAFEARTIGAHPEDLARSLASSKAWTALYYSVLAIGCQYVDADEDENGGGSFEPGKGMAWRMFSVALAQFSELLILPDSLITLQALVAMAVFGMSVSCLSIERVILSEASRRAQSLAAAGLSNSARLANSSFPGTPAAAISSFRRTFWLLYAMEKVMSFHLGRSSTFIDSDIACPFPLDSHESTGSDDAGPDWLLLYVQHARLLSRTYTALFSLGTMCNSTSYRLAAIHQLRTEMEEWRLSVPAIHGFRPVATTLPQRKRNRPGTDIGNSGSPRNIAAFASRGGDLGAPSLRTMALGIHLLYHSYTLILSHAELHHLSRLCEDDTCGRQQQRDSAEQAVMDSAIAILELTPFQEVEPYSSLWSLAIIPLTAFLTLFDLIIHNPTNLKAHRDLALLDMAAGYFSRIEYSSEGTLPGSLISEFAHIARDYVKSCQRGQESASAVTTDAQQPLPQAPLSPSSSDPTPRISGMSTMPSGELSSHLGIPQMTTWAASQGTMPPTIPASHSTDSTANSALASVDGFGGYGQYLAGYGSYGAASGTGGTDIMGLFNYYLPDIDPIVFAGGDNG